MQRQGDGCPLRDHIKAAQRQHGPNWWPEGMEPVDCPPPVDYLWGYFLSLGMRREAGKFLGYANVQAWAQMRGRILQAYELDALDRIETIFVHYECRAIAAAVRRVSKERK